MASDEPKRAESTWGTPEALMALYNRETPDELPEATVLSPGRRAKARYYLRMFPPMEFWRAAFREIHRSQFLRRRRLANFDWLLSKGRDGTENIVKVKEGRYRD